MDSVKLLNGKYKQIKEIGNGNYGKVFKVENVETKEMLAVKQLNKEDIQKDKYLTEAFFKELEIMKLMTEASVENTVRYVEFFQTTSYLNIVMELCDETLERWINNFKGYISEEMLKDILLGLNNVFQFMNEKNIAHRDVKLQNIMIKYVDNSSSSINFIPKLCDFGFSTINESMQTRLGTPSTMAPEIMLNKSYTKKCDIWSLAIIIFQMLFKQLPFKAKSQREILQVILNWNGLFNIPDNQKMSEVLHDLMKKMLMVDPIKRMCWSDYFSHPFFRVVDQSLETFEKNYGFARKLSDDNQGLYVITKAKNKKTGEFVYIKELDRKFIDSCEANLKIFNNEILMLKALSGKHPCFINFLDYFETKSSYLIITEYFEGKILESFIRSKKSLQEKMIDEILLQILPGLQHIVECNFKVHSLTPKSLWFKEFKSPTNFIIKFFDYGLLSIYNEPVYEREYDLSETAITEKRNVLSLGLIVYRMLFGVPLVKFNVGDDPTKTVKSCKLNLIITLLSTDN